MIEKACMSVCVAGLATHVCTVEEARAAERCLLVAGIAIELLMDSGQGKLRVPVLLLIKSMRFEMRRFVAGQTVLRTIGLALELSVVRVRVALVTFVLRTSWIAIAKTRHVRAVAVRALDRVVGAPQRETRQRMLIGRYRDVLVPEGLVIAQMTDATARFLRHTLQARNGLDEAFGVR